MGELFSYGFHKHRRLSKLTRVSVGRLSEIDRIISLCATEWPIDKINRIDLAILRLALAELLTKSAPKKVIIDEAVELAKEFGSQSSPAFVNGVLGTATTKLEAKKISP